MTNWQDFWDHYRSDSSNRFEQVGKTVNGQPIAQEALNWHIDKIRDRLKLNRGDAVADLCCGNGLVSDEIASSVNLVAGLDFSERLISNANQNSTSPRATYHCGHAGRLPDILPGPALHNKLLMSDALAYFEPDALAGLLRQWSASPKLDLELIYLTGIPDRSKRWNFYDTLARRIRFVRTNSVRPRLNDGMGRWWTASELRRVAQDSGYDVTLFFDSTYRFDALLTRQANRKPELVGEQAIVYWGSAAKGYAIHSQRTDLTNETVASAAAKALRWSDIVVLRNAKMHVLSSNVPRPAGSRPDLRAWIEGELVHYRSYTRHSELETDGRLASFISGDGKGFRLTDENSDTEIHRADSVTLLNLRGSVKSANAMLVDGSHFGT